MTYESGSIENGTSDGQSEASIRSASRFQSIGTFSKNLASVGALTVVAPYVIPREARCWMASFRRSHSSSVGSADAAESLNSPESLGILSGLFGGALCNLGQVTAYVHLALDGRPELLLVPVATNVASGLYELGLLAYNGRQNSNGTTN